MVKYDAILLGDIFFYQRAKKIGQMAQFITLFNQLAAPEIREPAAGCLIFQVDDIRYVTGVVFTGLNWIGAEAKFSQNIMYIGFVGVNIFTQTESGPAPPRSMRIEGTPEMAA